MPSFENLQKTNGHKHENAFLVAFCLKGKSAIVHKRNRALCEEHLDELGLLALSAGAEIVGRRIQEGVAVKPATLIGQGFMHELAAEVKQKKIRVVIFDNELTPTQNRNLETEMQCKVIDRTSLILDIFASRARTREGKIQVELAQMEYLYPRLVGRWMHFSRQEGGIGMRGPGETQLEVDRRIVKRRMQDLADKLDQIRVERQVRREKRAAAEIPVVSLVGYTNAGKSTLLNALSGGQEYTDDRLFATLDPVTRRVEIDQHLPVLVSDTVGFVQKLPHQLVAAFRATFEEIRQADLLIHVVDVSHPQADVQEQEVLSVLKEFEADELPRLTVYNKVDRVRDNGVQVPSVQNGNGHDVLYVSALKGIGLPELKEAIIKKLEALWPVVELDLPVTESRLRSRLYNEGAVLSEKLNGQVLELSARVPRTLVPQCMPFLRPRALGKTS